MNRHVEQSHSKIQAGKLKPRGSLPAARLLSSKMSLQKKIASSVSQVLGSGPALSSLTLGGPIPNVRCIKYSSRLLSSECTVPADSLQFETVAWRETFKSMGGLQKLKLKKYEAFTTLNKAPYHCSSLGRSYDVSHGEIRQVEGKSPVTADNKSTNLFRFIEPIEATKPKATRGLDCSIQRYFQQLRKDSNQRVLDRGVLVRWSGVQDGAATVCDWLQRYGNIVFSFYKSDSTLFVFFDTMKSASRAVNSSAENKQRGICIFWNDCRLYNYGFFRAFENDILSRDPAVLDVLVQRFHRPTITEGRILKGDTETSTASRLEFKLPKRSS